MFSRFQVYTLYFEIRDRKFQPQLRGRVSAWELNEWEDSLLNECGHESGVAGLLPELNEQACPAAARSVSPDAGGWALGERTRTVYGSHGAKIDGNQKSGNQRP